VAKHFWLWALLAIGVAVSLAIRARDQMPAPGSAVYEPVTSAFYRGFASLQTGLLDRARPEFARAIECVRALPVPSIDKGRGCHDLRSTAQ
jgi:hypothetical protein